MIASHLSGGKLSTGETCWMPALLTRMSGAPSSSVQRRIIASIAAGSDKVGAVVDGAELALQLLDLGRVAEAVEHHLGAFGGERAGDGEADAGGRAGDERDFAFENHGRLLWTRCRHAFRFCNRARASRIRRTAAGDVECGSAAKDQAAISKTAPAVAAASVRRRRRSNLLGCLLPLVMSRFGIVGVLILLLGYCALTQLGGGGGGLIPSGRTTSAPAAANRRSTRTCATS